MWFAALGSARRNPWFIRLIYRILTNQEEVLDLIDHNPFPKSPPKFIRAKLYHYHFTSWSKNSKNWWRRKEVETYLSPVTKESQAITSFVQSSGLTYMSKIPPSALQSTIMNKGVEIKKENWRLFTLVSVNHKTLFWKFKWTSSYIFYIYTCFNDKHL
ncbi:lipase maturation factor 2-like [Apostichopus japonicus]|uniref:lipase maturation factor 2-like n=1 Tax=Stichopus japonicus TaxID=307972 RepID=UPI003AB7CB8E